jgi:hypothetical protein
VTIRDRAAPRLTAPPATGNPRVDTWLRQVADAVNALPNLSVFSYATPESNVTASAPALGFNLNSTTSRLWAKTSGDTMAGWAPLA